MSTSKTKLVVKVRERLILSAQDRDEWVKCYETTSKLPSINIPCSKCQLGITATNGNLKSKVEKYGSISKLLESFVCKDCKSIDDQPNIIRPKVIKKAKIKQQDELSSLKDEHGRYNIPQVNFNPERHVYSIEEISKSPELTAEFTRGACLSPHVYLDNDDTCDYCPLFDNCACGVKQLSKARRKQLAAVEV
jgi:hypothetical protein